MKNIKDEPLDNNFNNYTGLLKDLKPVIKEIFEAGWAARNKQTRDDFQNREDAFQDFLISNNYD